MKVTTELLKEWAKSGKIKQSDVTGKKPATIKSDHAGMRFIKTALTNSGLKFVTELKFCDTRRFKFDVAIPNLKIAVEFEGIISEKSRHTTITGYSKDCEKYNLAVSLGWKVYRYTTLNYKNIENDLKLF